MGFSFGNAIAAVEDQPTRACLMRLGRSVDANEKTLSTFSRNADLLLGADPTASVGIATVNGVASTFMRSDAAPKISQGIAPTWTGIHTFSAQDVHNAGISLGLSGVIKSAVVDGATAIAYDMNDSIPRTTGYARQLRNGAVLLEAVSYDGRIGYGAVPQAGHVLAFLSNDSSSPTGAPVYVGILSAVIHSDTAETVTRLIGVVGAAEAQTATGLSAVVVNGVTGAACSNISAALSGKVLACFSGAMGQTSTIAVVEPVTKDINFGKNLHPAGGYDHMTVLWAPTFTTSSLTGYPSDANRPAITTSARLCIQDWGGGSAAGSAIGEYWAIRGEDSKGATETFPAHTGYIRMTYPRRTGGTTPAVHACHTFWEPWPNTATIRGGALEGDTYFDDNANFTGGLWEFSGTAGGANAWNYLLSSPGVDALGGGAAPTLGTIGGTGPAAAAQATWIKVNCADNVVRWVPAWV